MRLLQTPRDLVAIACLAIVTTVLWFLSAAGSGWPASLMAALALGGAVGVLGLLVLESFRRLEREVRLVSREAAAQVALAQVIAPRLPLPPLGGAAIDAVAAAELVRSILELRPRRILELGSGVSSLLIGYALEKANHGRLLTVEHSKNWAEVTRQRIQDHGLQHVVEVVLAPLSPLPSDLSGRQWYDISTLTAVSTIDLLIVDGPPAWKEPEARCPALPVLFDRLTRGALVFVDDSDRPAQKKMIRDWLERFPNLAVKNRIDTAKGLTVLEVAGPLP